MTVGPIRAARKAVPAENGPQHRAVIVRLVETTWEAAPAWLTRHADEIRAAARSKIQLTSQALAMVVHMSFNILGAVFGWIIHLDGTDLVDLQRAIFERSGQLDSVSYVRHGLFSGI
jgi:hypothetical protein